MKYFLVLSLAVVGGAAWSHPGHLTEAAGHSHWLAAGALAAAAAVALYMAAKARKARKTEEPEQAEADEEAVSES